MCIPWGTRAAGSIYAYREDDSLNISQDKRKRLAYVARRYYLEDQRQSDIARELGISRPMVSRLLAEARELGVVEITVHDPETKAARLLDRLRSISTIQGGVLVEDSGDNDEVNRLLSQGALQLLQLLGSRRLGVGWGYLIGQIVSWLEQNPQVDSTVTDICPLVGNASIPARNYQSNENIRLMAQQLGTALVNIGDYPSSPDFASLVRYGSLLQQRRACGRMLIYYFNEDGYVIQSDQDFAIQVPVDVLKRCPNIIGVCSANTSHKAVRGALKSGFFTQIVARSEVIEELLEH